MVRCCPSPNRHFSHVSVPKLSFFRFCLVRIIIFRFCHFSDCSFSELSFFYRFGLFIIFVSGFLLFKIVLLPDWSYSELFYLFAIAPVQNCHVSDFPLISPILPFQNALNCPFRKCYFSDLSCFRCSQLPFLR